MTEQFPSEWGERRRRREEERQRQLAEQAGAPAGPDGGTSRSNGAASNGCRPVRHLASGPAPTRVRGRVLRASPGAGPAERRRTRCVVVVDGASFRLPDHPDGPRERPDAAFVVTRPRPRGPSSRSGPAASCGRPPASVRRSASRRRRAPAGCAGWARTGASRRWSPRTARRSCPPRRSVPRRCARRPSGPASSASRWPRSGCGPPSSVRRGSVWSVSAPSRPACRSSAAARSVQERAELARRAEAERAAREQAARERAEQLARERAEAQRLERAR